MGKVYVPDPERRAAKGHLCDNGDGKPVKARGLCSACYDRDRARRLADAREKGQVGLAPTGGPPPTADRETFACGCGCGEQVTLVGARLERKKPWPVFASRECQRRAGRVGVKCATCSKVLNIRRSQEKRQHSHFCSPECRAQDERGKHRTGFHFSCKHCGDQFYRTLTESSRGQTSYCSNTCKWAAMRGQERAPRIEVVCEQCSSAFRVTAIEAESRQQRFCSPACGRAAQRRKPGERYIDRNGYAIITAPDGRSMPEHRHLIEQLLGRPLYPDENVHHINGVRDDNRTDGPLRLVDDKLRSGNLELWSRAQPSGQRVGEKLAWMAEFTQRYGHLMEQAEVSSDA